MNRSVLKRNALAGVAIAALAVAGCASEEPGDTNPSAAGEYASLTGEIRGSGASFPNNFYQAAIEEFETVAPDASITYEALGSSAGKKEFNEGLNDFGGTDSLVKQDQIPDSSSYYYIPTVAAPIAVVYNLSGVTELNLSGETLAKIFQTDITTWNDAAIAAENDGVALPETKITVVHRSEGSGTTNNFTKYLVAGAPGIWTLASGDTVDWPDTTVGAERNGGVAQQVKQTDGAIGYVDFADATEAGLSFASIKNKDGNYVKATLAGATAALDGAEIADDLTYDPINAAGADTYPITAPTYILVHPSYDDAEVGNAVKGFVKWLLTDGRSVAEAKMFAPLPTSLQEKALAKLDSVTVAG